MRRNSLPLLAMGLMIAGACGETAHTPVELQAARPDLPATVAAAITVTPSITGATVDTDKEDYFPGETVTIVGRGWAAGETVHLSLVEDPVSDGPHDWDITADETGRFTDTSFGPGIQHLGVTFTLTATGANSGSSVAVFTDGNPQSLSLSSSQNPVPVAAGSSATYAVTVDFAGNASACTLDLSAAPTASPAWPAPPDGGFFSFSPTAVTGSGGPNPVHPQSAITVTTPTGMAPGTYGFIVAATRRAGCQGMGTETVQLALIVGSSDNTPPVITPVITGTLGSNGWYTSDVTVTWQVTDPESAIGSTGGCATTAITVDTSLETLTCMATSAGGTNGQSVTIKRDATAPTASATRSPGANSNGWNNSDVTVTFSGADALSGIDSCSLAIVLSAEAEDQSASGTCTDLAGNVSAPASVSGINIDKTKPVIAGDRNPAPNAFGWNNTDVVVSFVCTDAGSGLDVNTVGGQTLSGEGANQSATNSGACADKAGNAADPRTVTGISIDKTAPVLSGGPTTAPNGAGWYKTDVTVAWTCSDALSGIAGSCPANNVLTDEGTGKSADAMVSDKAGNSASASVTGLKIDKTNPVVAVTGVSNGATYTLGSVPAASCSTADALSGVAVNASLSSSGGPVGAVTATCSGATDVADNAAPQVSVTYNVIYAWNGFFQPVENLPAWNSAKAGQSIPVKFSLGGNQGLGILAAGYPKAVAVGCPSSSAVADAIEEYAAVTANNGLVYDAIADQYNYVWKTDKNWAGKCFRLDFRLIDGTMHSANFRFTK